MNSDKNRLNRFAFKIFAYFIIVMVLTSLAALVISLRPFFYIHNGILNSFYSNKISDEYTKTDVDVEWGEKLLTIRNYKYIYEVDGDKYTKNYYQDIDGEYLKDFYVYYNKKDPSDSFVYKEGFKFNIIRLIVSIGSLIAGLILFIYVVKSFFDVFIKD